MNSVASLRINGQDCVSGHFPFFSGEEWEKEIVDFLEEWWNDSAEIALQTSGSTGIPRVLKMKKTALWYSASLTVDFFGLQAGQAVLLCLPARYIGGRMMLVRALRAGLEVKAVRPASDPLQFLHTEDRLDFAAMTPMQVAQVLENESSREKLERIRTLIIGGGEIHPFLKQRLQHLPVACYATYGMTETVSHVALQKLNGPDAREEFTVLPGIRISQDSRDCLVIDAPQFSASPIVTNDVVEFTDFTRFRWLGRFDNVVNSGGVKIYPEQLESSLSQWIDRRFFLAGVPDEKLGQKLVLVLEGMPFDEVTRKLFMNHLAESLPRYSAPKTLYFVTEFAETPTGKVRRGEILSHLL